MRSRNDLLRLGALVAAMLIMCGCASLIGKSLYSIKRRVHPEYDYERAIRWQVDHGLKKTMSDITIDDFSRIHQLLLNNPYRRTLPDFSRLSHLQHLDVSNCRMVTDLSPVAHLAELEKLNLRDCISLSNVTPLGELKQLRYLDMTRCEKVNDITPLSHLGELRYLNLARTNVNDLRPLHSLGNLNKLVLEGCQDVGDLSGLECLVNLRELSLYGCTNVRDMTVIGKLKNLRILDLGGTSIIDLSPLADLPELKKVSRPENFP